MNYKLHFNRFLGFTLTCLLFFIFFSSCTKPEKSFVVYSDVGPETIKKESRFSLKEHLTVAIKTQNIRSYTLVKFQSPVTMEQRVFTTPKNLFVSH